MVENPCSVKPKAWECYSGRLSAKCLTWLDGGCMPLSGGLACGACLADNVTAMIAAAAPMAVSMEIDRSIPAVRRSTVTSVTLSMPIRTDRILIRSPPLGGVSRRVLVNGLSILKTVLPLDEATDVEGVIPLGEEDKGVSRRCLKIQFHLLSMLQYVCSPAIFFWFLVRRQRR